MLDEALNYAAMGWPVFPIKPNAKTPLVEGGFKSATTNVDTIRQWWGQWPNANIATSPGESQHMVTDIDPGASQSDLQRAYEGTEPKTALVTLTPRGGVHRWHALSPGEKVAPSASKVAKHVDIRSADSYVLLPPSVTPDGAYAWMHHDANVWPTPPMPRAAYRSDAMIRAAGIAKAKVAAADKTLPDFVLLDDPVNVARYAAWLCNVANPGTVGENGNNMLAAAAAMGSSYGLAQETVVDLLGEHFNPRCAEAWTESDLEFYGGSGYRSASSRFGNMATQNAALMFSPVEGQKGWGPPMRAASFIAGKKAPARQWAAGDDSEGWLPLGELTTLYGPDGSGKTTLVGQWALAQARGSDIFGTIKTRKMPVLLIACEDDEDELHRRFEQQGIRPDDNVRYASFVGLDTAIHPAFKRGEALTAGEDTVFYRYLDYHLEQMGPGEKLLILDNLGQIYQGDYMDIPQVRAFLNTYCRRLLKKHNATGILLAHPSESQKVTGDGGFGSVAWSAGVRSRLYFDWAKDKANKEVLDPDVRLLSRKKASYGKKHANGSGLFLRWSNFNFIPVPAPEPPDLKPKKANEDSPLQANAKLAILRQELDRMFDGNPTREWDSESQVSKAVAARLGAAGQVGFSDETVRKLLPSIRNEGYHYFLDGAWGHPKSFERRSAVRRIREPS